MRLQAFAKINLGLDVLGKREDGYHEVRMIMQTIRMYDQLDMRKSVEPGIHLTTNKKYIPVDENNLVWRAAKLMMDTCGIIEGVSIHLHKVIPVAAGMAGGSSDAAATLVGMNRLFHCGLSKEKLMELGVQIGADVPYCVLRGTALAEGIGEKLTVLPPMPDCWILIGKPGISVSTKYVYGTSGYRRDEKGTGRRKSVWYYGTDGKCLAGCDDSRLPGSGKNQGTDEDLGSGECDDERKRSYGIWNF